MIFLGLGTNMGNREANIARALGELALSGIGILRCASVIETPAWGMEDQPAFLNTVAEVSFGGSARELLNTLLSVEEKMGRIREEKWGPRLIDLDIIEFNRQQIDEPGLQLPHPWYTQRRFVLEPLAQLEPGWVPAGMEVTVSELLKTF
ncbi:MAG: 2-amino-4-hydroxy-6-hydroxymethyldihydropteridine diphosphokinase [Bacteroidia bacterium]